jgi:hypothetical protein
MEFNPHLSQVVGGANLIPKRNGTIEEELKSKGEFMLQKNLNFF